MTTERSDTDYYEKWCKETISFQSSGGVESRTRKGLGLDISRDAFETELRIHKELIEKGAIKDSCYNCTYNNATNPLLQTKLNATNTVYKDGIWTCLTCNASWDPMKLRYEGI